MGQVEELPDDFDESLNLNDSNSHSQTQTSPQPTSNANANSNAKNNSLVDDSTLESLPASGEVPFPINEERLKEIQCDPAAPKMPPAMASVKSNTTDELVDMMNKTPLFMTDLEKAKDESMLFALCLFRA